MKPGPTVGSNALTPSAAEQPNRGANVVVLDGVFANQLRVRECRNQTRRTWLQAPTGNAVARMVKSAIMVRLASPG
jgi:hypothetical protein